MEAQTHGEVDKWLHDQPAPQDLDKENVPPTPSTHFADDSDEEEQANAFLSSASDAQSTSDTSDNKLPLLYEPSSGMPVSVDGEVSQAQLKLIMHRLVPGSDRSAPLSPFSFAS